MRAADLAALLDSLGGLEVNYADADAPRHADDPGWHVDSGVARLGAEAPGPPEPGGLFEAARTLSRAYEFTDHRLVRGIYRPADPLPGRDMVLEGRFLGLRFPLGVRVTAAADDTRDGPDGPQQVSTWTYRTLDGHLEQGELTYEVVKDLATGEVTFGIHAYSRRAPIPNPLVRLGMRVFGRPVQLSFYRRAGRRMHRLAAGHTPGAPLPRPVPLVGRGDGEVVVAPSTSRTRPWDPFALPIVHPGRVRRAGAAQRA